MLYAEDCISLSIVYMNLELTDEGQYAKPVDPYFFNLSALDANHYCMNMDAEGGESCHRHYNKLGHSIQPFTGGQYPAYDSGTGLCYRMHFSLNNTILKEEGLPRGEVMAILTTTITRLEHFYPKHLYIPLSNIPGTPLLLLMVGQGPGSFIHRKSQWKDSAGVL